VESTIVNNGKRSIALYNPSYNFSSVGYVNHNASQGEHQQTSFLPLNADDGSS
jgi:uncharacterized protein involved in high-affinity Fe2+ transport